MPRRKQDKPQHLDGEMDTTAAAAATTTAETEENSIDVAELSSGIAPAEAEEEMGDNQATGRQDNKQTVPMSDDLSSAARISVAEWLQVTTTLQALQHQHQLLQLQVMQALMIEEEGKVQTNFYPEVQSDSLINGETQNERKDMLCDESIQPDGSIRNDETGSTLQLSIDGGDEISDGEHQDEPPIYECSKCPDGFPSSESLESHMCESHFQSSTDLVREDGQISPGGMSSKNPVSQQMIHENAEPIDSMEEYMEIQKPENNQLEHLVKNLDKAVADPNQCIVCKRVLSCKSALQMHYRTHTGERPFKCKLCCRAFTTKGNLKTHMGVHRTKPPLRLLHTCPVCSKQFTNALVLNQHMRLHNDDSIRKRTFDMTSEAENSDSKRGRNISGEDSYQEEAPITATVEGERREQESTGLPAPPGLPFLFGALPMQDHLRYAEVLARQWEQMSQLSMLSNPMSSAAAGVFPSGLSSFQTAMNGGSFMNQTGRMPFDMDKKLDHDEPEREAPVQENGITAAQSHGMIEKDKYFTDISSEHKETSHSPTNKSERSSISNDASETSQRLEPPPGTTCDICMKTFACRSALEIHYRSHTKQRPFKCDMCDKAFTTRGNMKQHILTHKTDDLPWKVNERTIPNDLLANPDIPAVDEIINRKTGNRHQCSVCSKNFSSASALQIHFRTHTGDRPFKCTVCGKAFTTKGNLKVHMGTHMWNSSPSRRGRRLSVEGGNENLSVGHLASPSSITTMNNNNTMSWAGMTQAALMKASLLGGQNALFGGYPMMAGRTGEDESKPWLWQVTCHVCNKECQSPAALELHIKTHVTADKNASKPVTA